MTIVQKFWSLRSTIVLCPAQQSTWCCIIVWPPTLTIVIPLFLKYKICNLRHRTSREVSLHAQQHTLVERDTKIVLTKVCYTGGSIYDKKLQCFSVFNTPDHLECIQPELMQVHLKDSSFPHACQLHSMLFFFSHPNRDHSLYCLTVYLQCLFVNCTHNLLEILFYNAKWWYRVGFNFKG